MAQGPATLCSSENQALTMKAVCVAVLFLALTCQALAFDFKRAGGRYSCPTLVKFYESVIECAEDIDKANSKESLCREFRSGGCKDLYQVYDNDCSYGTDPVYRQLAPTMRDVETLCF